jgi:hypothetical protein
LYGHTRSGGLLRARNLFANGNNGNTVGLAHSFSGYNTNSESNANLHTISIPDAKTGEKADANTNKTARMLTFWLRLIGLLGIAVASFHELVRACGYESFGKPCPPARTFH